MVPDSLVGTVLIVLVLCLLQEWLSDASLFEQMKLSSHKGVPNLHRLVRIVADRNYHDSRLVARQTMHFES